MSQNVKIILIIIIYRNIEWQELDATTLQLTDFAGTPRSDGNEQNRIPIFESRYTATALHHCAVKESNILNHCDDDNNNDC